MDKREKRMIPHKDMPRFLNQFEEIKSHNYQADDRIPSVTVMEAVACGLKSFYHPWMTREWVIKNASFESQTDKLLKIYKKCLEN